MSCGDKRSLDILKETSFENCWVSVLAFLNPYHLTKYAVLSMEARRHTEHDLLWAHYMEDVKSELGDESTENIEVVPATSLKALYLDKKRVLCVECHSPTRYFFPLLKIRLCPKCESEAQTSQGSRYELCSKTDAKQLFFLERFDLNNLPSIKRNSPWATKSTELRLFLRSDVEASAVKKFGGHKAIQDERKRRKEENRMMGGEVKRSEYEVRLSRRTAQSLPKQPPPAESPSCSDSETAEKAVMSGSGADSSPPCSNSCGDESRSDALDSHGDSVGEDGKVTEALSQRERPNREVRNASRPEPLGAVIDTSAPHFVRCVNADSLAARRFGVQIGDRLITINARSVAAFKGGWPEMKAAIARRPVVLRFERLYHKYQQGALAPHRGGNGKQARGNASVPQRSETDNSAAGSSGAASPSRRQSASTVVKGESWMKNRPWQEVDYLAMGISGLEVRD